MPNKSTTMPFHAWVPEYRTMRYYMMEVVEGVNLREYLINRPLSINNAIALGVFLDDAQAHLLQLGLVHGDIKPENIIVTKKIGEAGIDFKMVDFGSIVEIFSLNSRAGTASYLAPERFTGGIINESTEIFSIGITMYWALTRMLPYGEIEPFQTPIFKSPNAYCPTVQIKKFTLLLDSEPLSLFAHRLQSREYDLIAD